MAARRPGLMVALALLLGAACLAAAAVGAAPPPPGATARCRDGSYSFSQHHSGTCSHHGGVARWLDGTATGATPAVGVTVPLARRTRTADCTLGPSPDRRCSPGAYYSKLTASVICAAGFRTGPIRNVPVSEKRAVEIEYGLAPASYGATLEIDHIVSLELGGSNDIANLFPEKADAHPGFHVKDRLENRLHTLVCSGAMGLRAAQLGIARNWEALYRRVFGVSPAG